LPDRHGSKITSRGRGGSGGTGLRFWMMRRLHCRCGRRWHGSLEWKDSKSDFMDSFEDRCVVVEVGQVWGHSWLGAQQCGWSLEVETEFIVCNWGCKLKRTRLTENEMFVRCVGGLCEVWRCGWLECSAVQCRAVCISVGVARELLRGYN